MPHPWTFPKSTPIIAPDFTHGDTPMTRAGAAHVLRDGDQLTMVYWGGIKGTGNAIMRATTTLDAPTTWQPDPQPLLLPQPDTSHNCQGPGFPHLLRLDDRHQLLYFCAWGDPKLARLPNTTGVAISEDAGQTFRYHDQHPVLRNDAPYEREANGSLWILQDQGKFRCWYTAIKHYYDKPEGVQTGHGDVIPAIGIGYAESADGLNWTKPYDDWVIAPRGHAVEPYEYIVSKPCVVKHHDSSYTIWVNTFGTAYRVHRLTSTDGVHWTWPDTHHPEGELGIGPPGSFDDHQRSYPTIIQAKGQYHCWYTGNGYGATGLGYAQQPV